ncbi:MAG: hypothetical protein VKN33_02260 [Candidatus Sericytochromatia bacterium]|nr:hypothetical protein [Candidatus Sericytochromatia bacterium]
MNHDQIGDRAVPGTASFDTLRAALSADAATPEIVAIFQQIKNLRESDRSLRSIRRNLDLDNVPTLDPVEEAIVDDLDAPSPTELSTVLDSFIDLKRENESLQARFSSLTETATALEAKVLHLTQLLERQATVGEPPAAG